MRFHVFDPARQFEVLLCCLPVGEIVPLLQLVCRQAVGQVRCWGHFRRVIEMMTLTTLALIVGFWVIPLVAAYLLFKGKGNDDTHTLNLSLRL